MVAAPQKVRVALAVMRVQKRIVGFPAVMRQIAVVVRSQCFLSHIESTARADQGVQSLQGMTTLNPLATAGAAADVDIEFSVNRFARNLCPVLLGAAQELDAAATERTLFGQRGDVGFIDFSGHLAVSNRTIVITGFATGLLGIRFGRSFRERRRLALPTALESFDQSAQLLQFRTQPGVLNFQCLNFYLIFRHVNIIVTALSKNENYALINYLN
jgi:hypothetical protein